MNKEVTYLDNFLAGKISSKELVELDKKQEFSINDNLGIIFKLFDMRKFIARHKSQKNALGDKYQEYVQISPEDYKVFIDEGYINSTSIFGLFEQGFVKEKDGYKFIHFLEKNNIELDDENLKDYNNLERFIRDAVREYNRFYKNQDSEEFVNSKEDPIKRITRELLKEEFDEKELNKNNPSELIKYFLIANKDEIKEHFNDDENYSKEEAENILENNKILNKEYSKEDLDNAKLLLECRKIAYSKNHSKDNKADIKILKFELGDLVKSSYVLEMLYSQGIISRDEAIKDFGGDEKFVKRTILSYADKKEKQVKERREREKAEEEAKKTIKEKYLDIIASDELHAVAGYIRNDSRITANVLRGLFQDKYQPYLENQTTEKREKLINLFNILENQNLINNDDKMGLIVSIYSSDDNTRELQKDFNYKNFKYFFDNKIVDNVIKDKEDKSSTGTGITRGGKSNKINKLSYPILERYEELFKLDDDVIFRFYDNSYIFEYLNLNKVAIEAIGQNVDGVINEEQTVHRTYLMNRHKFLANEEYYVEEKDDRKAFKFKKFIPWFNQERANDSTMIYHNHTSGWINNVRESLGLEKLDLKERDAKKEEKREKENKEEKYLKNLYLGMLALNMNREMKRKTEMEIEIDTDKLPKKKDEEERE